MLLQPLAKLSLTNKIMNAMLSMLFIHEARVELIGLDEKKLKKIKKTH